MNIKTLNKLLSVICAGSFALSAMPLGTLISAQENSTPSIEGAASSPTVKNSKDMLLTGDYNKDGSVTEEDADFYADFTNGKPASDMMQCDVNGDGEISEIDYNMIQSFVSDEIGYFPVGQYYDPDAEFITRGEWIHALVDGFQMSATEDSDIVEYFTDIADCEYADDITLSANFGVFDIMGEEFNPDAFVTRDFASHTMNFCLGYPSDVEAVFTDADAVYYSGDAQVAVDKGWFETVEGEFRPSMYVTAAEASIAYNDMNEAFASTQFDDSHVNEIEYAESVKHFSSDVRAEFDGTVVKLYVDSVDLEEGDNFTFIFNDLEIIRKVDSISETDDYIAVSTLDADEDSILSCDIEGEAYIDYDNIELLYDGAEDVLIEGKPIIRRSSVTKPLQLFNQNFPIGDGVNLNVSGSISNIKVDYKWNKGSNFYLKMNADASLSAKLTALLNGKKSNYISLFKIPVVGEGGFMVYLECGAVYSLTGELTLTYSCNVGAGLEWTKSGGFRSVQEFRNKSVTLTASASESLGIKLSLTANELGHKLADVYALVGEKGNIRTVATSSTDVVCTQLDGHVFVEVGFNADLFIAKFQKTITPINESNSPARVSLHWENGKLVPKCTKGSGLGTVGSAGGSYGGAGSGGYVPGYGYVSGYGYGTHGSYWYSKFYNSTMAFQELAPPLIITEDRILTEDLEIDEDVILRAKLDLNGHKLTCNKNLTLDNRDSYLLFNKGTAVVKGDFSVPYGDARILMENTMEKFTVEGETRIPEKREDQYVFKAGVLEFKGDVIASTITSSDSNLVILSGTGDQSVGLTSASTLRLLEIKNSDDRTITVTGPLWATTSTTIDGKTLKVKVIESEIPNPLGFGKLNAQKVTIDGNFGICSTDFSDAEVIINGNISEVDRSNKIANANSGANVNLVNTKMTVNGDYITMQRCSLDNSQLTVTGDFSAYQGEWNWIAGTYGGSTLSMNSRNDKLTVGGDLLLRMCNNVTDGIIDVKGKITLDGAEFKQNNKVILSSDKDQSLSLESDDKIQKLEVLNSDKRVIYMDNNLNVRALISEGPVTLVSRSANAAFESVSCTEFTIQGDVNFNKSWVTTTLCAPKNTFDGNVISSCKMNLLDADTELVVNGTYTNNNTLTLNEGTVTVNDFENSGNLEITGGQLYIKKNLKLKNGSIVMALRKDLIDIKGNIVCTRTDNYDNIQAGTIRLEGNIEDSTERMFQVESSAKLVLAGEKDQEIYFLNTYSREENSHFSNLEVLNSDNRSIIVPHQLRFGKITSDTGKVSIKTSTDDTCYLAGTLDCDIDLEGDLYFGHHTLDLNGYTLNVSKNMYLCCNDRSWVKIGVGRLNVNGDLNIGTKSGSKLSASNSALVMNDDGYVYVGGNFNTKTNIDHSEYLTAGTIEIKGDFHQYADGTTFAFPASGTHKVILSGDDTQKVTFESYPDSHFNILKLTKDASNYEFNPEECWNELVSETDPPETTEPETEPGSEPITEPSTEPGSEEAPVGDANGDNVIDLKDVMIIRRFYAGGWDVTINEKAADVNHDGSVDLKDALIIRRYYAGGWDIELK